MSYAHRTARAELDGHAVRTADGTWYAGHPDIDIDVSWPFDMPADKVLDQFDALAASVRTQIEAHQEKP